MRGDSTIASCSVVSLGHHPPRNNARPNITVCSRFGPIRCFGVPEFRSFGVPSLDIGLVRSSGVLQFRSSRVIIMSFNAWEVGSDDDAKEEVEATTTVVVMRAPASSTAAVPDLPAAALPVAMPNGGDDDDSDSNDDVWRRRAKKGNKAKAKAKPTPPQVSEPIVASLILVAQKLTEVIAASAAQVRCGHRLHGDGHTTTHDHTNTPNK